MDSSFGGGQLLLAAPPALGSDMHLTSDGADEFYCAWTDGRTGKGVPPERFLGYLDIDVGGRRVAALEVGASGIGKHVAKLGRLEGADAGIYWARLHQGSRTATARVVVVE